MKDLASLNARFLLLSDNEQDSLIAEIEKLLSVQEIEVKDKQISAVQAQGPTCPHCSSQSFHRSGKRNGMQQYRCKDCGKYYRESTGTLVAWLKKPEKLKEYIRHMISGKSIRACAKETGISIQTSFDWRHKVLTALGKANREVKLSGICECDDIYLPYSQKGQRDLQRPARKRGKSIVRDKRTGLSNDLVSIIASVDRQGNQFMQVAKRGQITQEKVKSALAGRLSKGSVLCTDSHKSYAAFTRKAQIKHVTIKPTQGIYTQGIYHVQHVNQKTASLKHWLAGFNGVSTKYLQNYLNWFALTNVINRSALPSVMTISIAVQSLMAWFEFDALRSGAYVI